MVWAGQEGLEPELRGGAYEAGALPPYSLAPLLKMAWLSDFQMGRYKTTTMGMEEVPVYELTGQAGWEEPHAVVSSGKR